MTRRNTTLRDKHRKMLAFTEAPCGICGRPIDYSLPHLDPGAFVVDHIVPISRGGQDFIENKQPAHRSCNSEKRDKPSESHILRRSGSLVTRRD